MPDLSTSKSVALKHAGNESVYDDPKFSVVCDLNGASEWYVTNAAGDVKWAGEGQKGTMTAGATGSVNLSGPVMFSFNMETRHKSMASPAPPSPPSASATWCRTV